MAPAVSVVIPALDEEKTIAGAVRSALQVSDEVTVVDGGSTDRTAAVAAEAGARVVLAGIANRAAQMNAGAGISSGQVLLFLHADTQLPADALVEIGEAVAGGAEFGGFRLRFVERTVPLRVAERLINLRTRFTRCPWGDQAQFVLRSRFDASGRFRELPLLEDYDFAVRMRRETKSVLLRSAVTTSGRRFRRLGVLGTAIVNWLTIAGFRLGVPVERLARLYKSL